METAAASTSTKKCIDSENFVFAFVFFAVVLFGVFGCLQGSQAASPVLNFSDIADGPKSGLNDGLGQGVIVTIWGNNLGSLQGTSKVYFKDSTGASCEATYVYYWKNADGQLPGGPANLYESHKMQEIAFSIPSAAANGAGKIYVKIDGINSNELDFYARSNGHIHWVKGGGSDSNPGTWDRPWETIAYAAGSSGTAPLEAGDIVYFINVSDLIYRHIWVEKTRDGSPNNMIGFLAYPGQNINTGAWHTDNCCAGNVAPTYFTLSKMNITSDESSSIGPHSRMVGCAITEETNEIVNSYAIYAGAEEGGDRVSDTKWFGIYIYNYGGPLCGNQAHTTYFSHRGASNGISTIEGFEVGWCYLKDNEARGGIHFYDEQDCGDVTTKISIHDNFIYNQRGWGIGLNTPGCWNGYSMTLRQGAEIYNNIVVQVRPEINPLTSNPAIAVAGAKLYGHVQIYNNVVYGYGKEYDQSSLTSPYAYQVWSAGGSDNGLAFAGTYEFFNNIAYDTYNHSFCNDAFMKRPVISGNNIWYNGGDGNPVNPPSWDTNPITSNPFFVNPSSNNFTLQSNSPAINAGSSLVSSIVKRDFFGLIRPQGTAFDIGAYEYVAPSALLSDINSDGKVDSADIQDCIAHILGAQDWGAKADVNQDGSVNVIDVQEIVNIILGN